MRSSSDEFSAAQRMLRICRRIDRLDAYVFVNLSPLVLSLDTMAIMSNTEYGRLRADSKKFAGVELDDYVECTAVGQLALRPGEEKALYQASKDRKLYWQERLMAETMERLTTASFQVMAKLSGFLSTLGRWLKSSAGYVHREGESPLDIIALKVATRLDLSKFEKVPATFRTSLEHMSND